MTIHSMKNMFSNPDMPVSILEIENHLSFIFRITIDGLPHIFNKNVSKEDLYNLLLEKFNELDPNIFLREIKCVTLHQKEYGFSWLLTEGINHDYLILDIIEEFAYKKFLKSDFFIEAILCEDSLIPFDFRGKLLSLFVSVIKKGIINFNRSSFEKLQKFIINFKIFSRRSIKEKLEIPTDGIDHLFPIPNTLEDKLVLLSQASIYKTKETIFNDIWLLFEEIKFMMPEDIRVLMDTLKNDNFVKEIFSVLSTLSNGQLISDKVKPLIDLDVNTSFRTWKDYVVCWDQQVVNFKGYTYTISELFRICLITSELSTPDLLIRTEVLRLYRSLLKISGRATIGLKAAIYYGEHGVIENPTFFYMGRDSIIGKGCIIDPVGGIIMLSKSYLGGGFIPILVHTHKHLLIGKNKGADERKKILPCILVARQGARFPMTHSILFEAADYINKKTPYKDIDSFEIDNLI